MTAMPQSDAVDETALRKLQRRVDELPSRQPQFPP